MKIKVKTLYGVNVCKGVIVMIKCCRHPGLRATHPIAVFAGETTSLVSALNVVVVAYS